MYKFSRVSFQNYGIRRTCISIRAFLLIFYELRELCKEMTRDLACCNIVPDRINRKTARVLWFLFVIYKNV